MKIINCFNHRCFDPSFCIVGIVSVTWLDFLYFCLVPVSVQFGLQKNHLLTLRWWSVAAEIVFIHIS